VSMSVEGSSAPEFDARDDAHKQNDPPRLIIVDDELPLMQALCDTLALEGYVVRGFGSPREALLVLRPGEFDLLITDLMMPDLDGIALGHAARKIDPQLATIVMTGHGTIDTAVRALQEGALDYVLKPFKLDAIRLAIARAVDVQRLKRAHAALQASERRKSQDLELAVKDLESFSYSVSHDLQAPLRAIQSFAQIIEDDYAARLDAEGLRLFGIIRGQAQSMSRLIVGLLEFSRAASNTQRLATEMIDMTLLADAAASEVRAVYRAPPPLIDIGELPAATGDATVLRQVWVNLIGNALKYSAKRPEPRVIVRGRIEGDEAIYSVEDNGAGFDMRYADKLFGVFQRLHNDSQFSGTGVGLAIVQRVVTRHGGRVWAEATPDSGACFSFSLPFAARSDLDQKRDGQ
jgi:two-component system, sensor histidine kinase and response regulator